MESQFSAAASFILLARAKTENLPKREFKAKTEKTPKREFKPKTGKIGKREFSLKFKTGIYGIREFKAKTGILGKREFKKPKREKWAKWNLTRASIKSLRQRLNKTI